MAETIALDEALQRVLEIPCDQTEVESVALSAALGRRLARPVATDGPWPATDRSAMDGFAVAAGAGLEAGQKLPVVGESLAGHPFAGPLPAGAAIRIMTGAVVPEAADAVVPVELTSGYEGDAVEFREAVRAGQNVRPCGSEAQAGQEIMQPGQLVRAAEVGALAVLGKAMVEVHTRPRVAIVATGDEVVAVDEKPAPHQLRESNSWALQAQVEATGGVGERLGVAADEPGPLREMLQHGLESADVLVTIGGISKGTHDLVHGTLAELGVEKQFHGIRLKPGKPTFFGVRPAAKGGSGRDTLVFGLPGNPASCFTVFDLLVRPMLHRLQGARPAVWETQARLAGAPWRKNPREQAIPARIESVDTGLVATLTPFGPSGNPFGLLPANGYVLLPPMTEPDEVVAARVLTYGNGVELA
ncbi:MAG: gephyrin-like molybdotransferase Glp [Planctomycetota bacterium]|nr:gephyrin-like molybdotransferase Glp [Planctomycetota bacterium]